MPNSTFVAISQEEQAQRLAALRLSAALPYFAVVCHWTQPDGHRGGPVLLTLQRVSHGACVSSEGA